MLSLDLLLKEYRQSIHLRLE